MRAKSSVFLSLLQGEQLDLVALVEIETASTPLRYAIDTHPRTWNGKTFEPKAGAFSEIEESAERRIPTLRLAMENADGVLGARVHPDVPGGEDIRGRRASIWQVSREHLGNTPALEFAIEWVFFVEGYSWIGREAVVLDLGVFPAEAVRVPDRTLQGLRCRWTYKGEVCGYTGTLASCDKTLADCKRHFSGEPLRFGAFPTSADARALRV